MVKITRINKKNYEFRYRYQDKLTGKEKGVRRRGFSSSAEAQKAYEILKRTIDQGFDNDEQTTVVEYIEYWIKEYKQDKVAKNTLRLHQRNLEKHIKPHFQNLKLKDLTHKFYQKFINKLIESHLSKRSVEIIHGTMYGAMYRARIEKKVQDNPCNGIVIYSSKEAEKRKLKNTKVSFLPYDQINDFLEVALEDNYNYYAFFKFLIETGVRKGEACALKWHNVDLDKKKVSIVETIDYEAKTEDEMFDETKTYKSTRIIPIPARLAQDLKAHKVRQDDNRYRFNTKYKDNLNLVFCREDGSPLPKSTLFNAFKRILKKIDIEPMRIHTLRHTFVVLMLEAGASMKYIQTILGHGSESITSDVYAHISENIERETMDSYEKYTDSIFQRSNSGH